MMDPANDDGNCLPSCHEDAARSGFQRVVDDDNGGGGGGGVGLERGEDGNKEEDAALSLNELMYSAHSFHVISLPVSITMTLAALCVTYVNTPQTIQQGADMMSQAYHVWKVDAESDSTSRQLVLDFANGLVIVTFIGTMTFGIVLLYKYRCMKVLVGYMMFSSMTLLGVLGGELSNVAIEKYRIPVDWFTFVFVLVNFAVVGVTAIFYGRGIPTYVTQGYLICSSVIISWQLSHFDTISTWTLLIMLGLYDLCAVLTPCGPLRALVNLMSDEDSPDMPGLLYEAEIPEGLKRPVMSGRRTDEGGGGGRDGNNRRNGDDDDDDDDDDDSRSDSSVTPPSSMTAEGYRQPTVTDVGSHNDGASSSDPITTTGASSTIGDVEMSSAIAGGNRGSAGRSISDNADGMMERASVVTAGTTNDTAAIDIDRQRSETSRSTLSSSHHADNRGSPIADAASSLSAARVTVTAAIPFGIAKLYRLPLTSAPPFGTVIGAGVGRRGGGRGRLRRRPVPPDHISTSPLLQSEGVAASEDDDSSSSPKSQDGNGDALFVIPDHEYTAAQMQTIVEAIMPSNGATVVKQPPRSLQGDREARYAIIGADGTLRRVLFVDKKNGKVYEETQDDDDDGSYEGRFSNSIKLGLGDFIFYSVLVAKSAQYSFPCFVSSFLVILAGLGGTLVLLAVYKHALPALPISIFLAVGFYVLVRFMAEPWIHAVMSTPFYV